MKLKRNENLVARTIAGQTMLVPVGQMAAAFNGMITLNTTAKFIWEHMEEVSTREELTAMMLDAFEVDEETANSHVNGFLDMLLKTGFAADTDAK